MVALFTFTFSFFKKKSKFKSSEEEHLSTSPITNEETESSPIESNDVLHEANMPILEKNEQLVQNNNEQSAHSTDEKKASETQEKKTTQPQQISNSGRNYIEMYESNKVDDYKFRFLICLLLTIPLLILSPMIQSSMNMNLRFTGDTYIVLALGTLIFFYGGWLFFKDSLEEIKQLHPGKMTLISLAITSSYIYSALATFGIFTHEFFWKLSLLIVILLLGHWITMHLIARTSNSLEKLTELLPSKATKISSDGQLTSVPIGQLITEDLILVNPGEKIPVDGLVIEGHSAVDEFLLTGDSSPIDKGIKSEVLAGSLNGEGTLKVIAKNTGENLYLSKVIRLVDETQKSSSSKQNLINSSSKWLFYIVLFVGIATLISWLYFGKEIDFALERMIAVFIIASPFALGLAIPLVIAKSVALASAKGLIIRNRQAFEEARFLHAVAFNKTGTLTNGQFGVTNIVTFNNYDEDEVIFDMASVEAYSQHPLAAGILKYAEGIELELEPVSNFKSIAGVGIQGYVDGVKITVCSAQYVIGQKIPYDKDLLKLWSNEGKTVIFSIANDKLAGMVALADTIRSDAKEAVEKLEEMDIQSIILTGENQRVAHYIGQQLDIKTIYAELLPREKAEKINYFQQHEELEVAMTGDDIHEAIALKKAELGVSTGTNITTEVADVIFARSNPLHLVDLIKLSKATHRKIKQNLWWAIIYNLLAVPLAAGILFNFGILLDPILAAILTSLSTIFVAINASLLKIK